MKKYIITTDSTCDLTVDYAKEHGLIIVPLYYMIDEVVYGNEVKIEPKEFYDKMRSGKTPSTMAVIPSLIHDTFVELIKEGYSILHISFSSALSSSYNNCMVAAEDISESYPDAKITIVDSLCASLGEGLLVHKAVKMKESGASYEKVHDWLEQSKLNICHQFTVDNLVYLQRGGRVSKTTAVIGTIINVKPVLHVDNNGALVPLFNVRGRKKALTALVDNMEKALQDYDGENDDIFIGHGDSPEDANFVADLVREKFGFKNITIGYISPTIGAHSGPGTIALFYMGSNR